MLERADPEPQRKCVGSLRKPTICLDKDAVVSTACWKKIYKPRDLKNEHPSGMSQGLKAQFRGRTHLVYA